MLAERCDAYALLRSTTVHSSGSSNFVMYMQSYARIAALYECDVHAE